MHNPPILCVAPATRPLSAVTETGGAQTWTVPAGVTQVAFPPRGAPGAGLADAGGCASTQAGGLATQATATLPVTAATVLQVTDGQADTSNPAGSSGGGVAVTGPAGGRAASHARTPAASGMYTLANQLLDGGGGAGADGLPGPRPARSGANADSPRRNGRGARDGGTTLGDGAGRGTGLAERRYVRARFGGLPVFIAPELAAQIRAARTEHP